MRPAPSPSRSRMFPTSTTLDVPNSGKPEFGWERGGVRGYKPSTSSNPLTPTLSPAGRGSPAVPRPRSCPQERAKWLEAALANERTLEGQVAIVTGGVRRLGRAMALSLAQDGAAVVINARSSREEAERTAAEVEKAGSRALVHLADITDEMAVGKMVDAVLKAFGRIDILVNNAAVRAEAHFLEMTLKQWHEILGVILDGSFLCSRAVLPHMLKNKY